MTTTSKSTRRAFIQAAGSAVSVPLAVAATSVPMRAAGDGDVRLAHLEDLHAIRVLNLDFAKRRGLAPADFGEQDVIEVALDRASATARQHCQVNVEEPIGPDCPLVEMARQQGGGVVRRTERGVFEHEYIRRDGAWTIERSAYRAIEDSQEALCAVL
jgi:hypothetical protein